MRLLSSFEDAVAVAVVDLGRFSNWEFAAYLEGPSGPLIELITRMRSDGADPSQDVQTKAAQGTAIVVHHNHLSQQSLSSADWYGLVHLFAESFAHCADGTVYWGRVLKKADVGQVLARYEPLRMNATNHLFNQLPSGAQSSDIAEFFSKEVVNQAMSLRGFVEYEVQWGSGNVLPESTQNAPNAGSPAGILGCAIAGKILEAAKALAPTL
jgi:hypothetical protein